MNNPSTTTETTTHSALCLVIVFNHKYEQNIPKLQAIYKDKFDHITFLMPFGDETQDDVVPVYDSSYRFEGYFAQGYHHFAHDKYSHYVFVGDDLILHPRLTQNNLISELCLDDQSGYIKSLTPLSQGHFDWPHMLAAMKALVRLGQGGYVNAWPELPSGDEALQTLRAQGHEFGPLTWQHWRDPAREYRPGLGHRLRSAWWLARHGARRGYSLPFPLLQGYSDFVVVPAAHARQFCRLCGVFSALDLFAEVAIPTALALSCPHVVTEKDTPWHGVEIWDQAALQGLLERNHFSLPQMLQSYDDNQLYLHPLKLSKLQGLPT